jgi:penicillin-binding protein 1A
MLKGPHYYNPTQYPERVRARRNLVLAQMVKDGQLPLAEYRGLRDRPMRVSLNLPAEPLGEAPHFAAYVRKWLADWAEKNDHDLYADGLVVQTTLDSKLQAAATEAVERQAQVLQNIADVEWGQGSAAMLSSSVDTYAQMRKRTEPFSYFWKTRGDLGDGFVRETPEYKKLVAGGVDAATALARIKARPELMARLRAGKTRIEAGFVAIEPASGEIKAWVGSRDFQRDQYDHVAQAERQPGSTFKPIVYGAALEQGRSPNTVYYDKVVEFRQADGSIWRPTDMSGASGEAMTLRQGLTYSKNSITAQVMRDVGIPSVMNLAKALGVNQSKLDPVPSMALGTSSVTLLEMVSAYATIAQLGDYRRPVFIKRITDKSGKVLAEFTTERKRAMSPETAGTLIDIMRDVVSQGTGTAIRGRFGIVADVAGKTGTTQNNTDGWFILMHPGIVAGAWVGFNDARVTMRSSYWGQGGHNAILVVGDFFRDALKAGLIDAKAEFPRRTGSTPALMVVSPEAQPEPQRPEEGSAGLSNASAEPNSVIVLDRMTEQRPAALADSGRGTSMDKWQRVDRLPTADTAEGRD